VYLKRAAKKVERKIYILVIFLKQHELLNEVETNKIFILSVLHHLLDLNKIVEPYHVTLSCILKSKQKNGLRVLNSTEKPNWGKTVLERLALESDLKHDEFVVLAGQEYIKPIVSGITNLINPLSGLREGERVKFLNDISNDYHALD
jgi:hypothetical protein